MLSWKIVLPLPRYTPTRQQIAASENSAEWSAAPKCAHFVDIASLVSTPREVSL